MFVVGVGPFLLGEEVDEVLLSLEWFGCCLETFSTLGVGERFLSFSPTVVISSPEIIL